MMWWKLVLLSIYLVCLFVLSRILEAVAYYEGGYLSSRLLDPVSLSVRKLKTLLDQRGVSYTGVVEKQELTDMVESSGEVTEGELEAANITGEDATSTNFTCGSHFNEEVEDTKDSVWLVQVVPHSEEVLVRMEDWKTLMQKVSRFGVRTGLFDCSLDRQSCNKKKWFTSRLVLALPQGQRHKDNVVLRGYSGSTKVPTVFNWVNSNLASRTKEIYSFSDLERDWFIYDSRIKRQIYVHVVLFSKMKIPPMFFSALSVKFTGRVKFGIINIDSKEGRRILSRLRYKKIPKYLIIMPEKNLTYGEQSGQYLNFKSLELFLKTVQPEANDIFKFSLFVINVACLLEFFIVQGGFLKRICKLVWCIGKWNCIFILLWLPLLGLFQLSYMETIMFTLLKILRTVGTTEIAAKLRQDWLRYSSTDCHVLIFTFLVFSVVAGLIEYMKSDGRTPQDNNNNDSDWRSVSWDSYMNYFFRPVTVSLTQPMNRQDMDLEVGMELLIERLAVPNFWLHPMISSDYMKELPVWTYTGMSMDSDSESGSRFVDSDSDEWFCGQAKHPTDMKGGITASALPPPMFVCEKCRALQLAKDGRHTSAEELAESESACAKFVMDGDYKCMCRDGGGDHEGWHSDDEVIRKPNRGSRHRTLSSDNLLNRHDDDAECVTPDDLDTTSRTTADKTEQRKPHTGSRHTEPHYCAMPPGILPCSECVICLESYKYGVILCGLPCGHSFHQQCILGWLARDNHCCPVCRWPTYKAKPCSMHLHSE